MIEPKIRPDAPGTQPGDVGNGRVLVVDERTQKFNGRNYHLKKGYYVCTVNKETHQLHIDVWTFHNSPPPEGYIIHHEHRDPDGNFDRNENNIEWLRLMTASEHSTYHIKNRPPVRHVKYNTGIDVIVSWLDDIFVEDDTIDDSPEEIRICPICDRQFKVLKTSDRITCSPEHEAIADRVERAQNDFYQRQLSSPVCLVTFINTQIEVEIRCLMTYAKAYFAAKDICDALNKTNVSQAVKNLKADRKAKILFPAAGGFQKIMVVNESGLLQLIINSKVCTLETEIFMQWLVRVVMPTFYILKEYKLNGSGTPPWLLEDTTLTIEPIDIMPYAR